MDFKTMRAFSFLLLCASQIFLLGLVGAADGLKLDLIGIDIGSRYSCMGTGVGDDNDIVIIENDQGNRITPSMVSFTDTEILIGEAAKNQTSLNPEGTIFNFKRLIGRNFDDSEVQREIKFLPYKIINKDGKPYIEVKVNGETKLFSPEDITAMMLGKMKEMAELYLGKEITSAIVTIPAYFNDAQRKATEYAAAKAGLNKTFLLHEPEAIASAYGHPYKTNKANVLIFDFGDSTFDVTIFALYRGNFEVLTATSTRYSDDINLLEPLTNLELDVHLFNKTVKKALEDAGLKETDIDEIIIEGGSSRRLFPNVQQLLKNLFNEKEPIMSRFDNPHEIVAFGAAVVAADTNNPKPTLCSIPLNYNPLSLGIEVDGGVMMKMTPANTIFPSNRSQTFTTCTDQQTIVSIKVYEGEGNLTKDCYELSRFYLTIPPAPRGVPQIEVTFLLDGYLRVVATDKATNKSESKNFYLGLNEQEFAESLEDFDYEEFKRYTEYLKKLKEKTDSPGTSLKPSLQHEEHQ